MFNAINRMMARRRLAFLIVPLSLLPSIADATAITFKPLVCTLLLEVRAAVRTAGASLVVIMFIYGAVKYAFSADDPGGRKSGKMTCIHALIGGILIVLFEVIQTLVSLTWWGTCP
ncbi:MAG: hypothetical protein V1875_02610 [Candidatus Altiarchaeota archaeon]